MLWNDTFDSVRNRHAKYGVFTQSHLSMLENTKNLEVNIISSGKKGVMVGKHIMALGFFQIFSVSKVIFGSLMEQVEVLSKETLSPSRI